MTMTLVPAPIEPQTRPLPQTLTCEDAALVATVINIVWKDCVMPEPGVDAAFADLMAGFSGVLPDCWHRRMFQLVCTEGIEGLDG